LAYVDLGVGRLFRAETRASWGAAVLRPYRREA
jgi:hypothetical protein